MGAVDKLFGRLALASVLLAPPAAAGAQPGADVLERMSGVWQGECQFSGRPCAMRLVARDVLGGAYVRLEIENRITGAQGQARMFEGLAYYRRTTAGAAEAVWLDSNGDRAEVRATLDAHALRADWQTAAGRQGRSEYRLLDEGRSLEVVDAVRGADGSFETFGRAFLERVAAD